MGLTTVEASHTPREETTKCRNIMHCVGYIARALSQVFINCGPIWISGRPLLQEMR